MPLFLPILPSLRNLFSQIWGEHMQTFQSYQQRRDCDQVKGKRARCVASIDWGLEGSRVAGYKHGIGTLNSWETMVVEEHRRERPIYL